MENAGSKISWLSIGSSHLSPSHVFGPPVDCMSSTRFFYIEEKATNCSACRHGILDKKTMDFCAFVTWW